MPTARARYRRRPVLNLLARGMVERDSPGGAAEITPPVASFILLVDGASFLLLTNGTDKLQKAA